MRRPRLRSRFVVFAATMALSRSCSTETTRPTHHFFVNETYFHLFLLAYNLVNWSERLCLPPEFQNATLQTLRHTILLMPAQLGRVENRPGLTLPTSGLGEAA